MPMFTRPSVKHCKTILHAKKVIQHAVKQQNQKVLLYEQTGVNANQNWFKQSPSITNKTKHEKVVHTTFGWKLESEKTGSKQKLR